MAAWTSDDFEAEHKPTRATARVSFRQDLWDQHARLDAELHAELAKDASENRDPLAPALSEALLAVEAEIAASEREFVFQSIGRQAWVQLLTEHGPETPGTGVDHNPATFPPAAVAASAVEPTIDIDTARKMFDELNLDQWARLWGACLTANIGSQDFDAVPKSALATVVARRLEPSSTTAAPEESLSASS